MKKKIIILLILLCTAAASSAQDVSRQRSARQKIEKEIILIDRQLTANRKLQKTNTTELALLKKKTAGLKNLIGSLEESIKKYEKDINLKTEQIRTAEMELDTMQVRYIRLVREAYKIRDSKVWFLYIIASEDVGEGYRRWKYLQSLSVSLKDRTEKLRLKKTALEESRTELDRMKKETSLEKEKQHKEYMRLQKSEEEISGIVRKLSGQEKSMIRKINAKRKESEQLNREINRIIAEAVRKAENQKTQNQQDKKDKSPARPAAAEIRLSGEFSANRGKLPWPIAEGVIVERFGQHNHPVFKHIKMPYNNGVNISAPEGAKVKSVFKGTVKQILVVPGYNHCILIQHGQYFTFYCRLKSVNVKNGQHVDAGSVIGTADTENGNACLHFEIWKGTVKQNPELWLR